MKNHSVCEYLKDNIRLFRHKMQSNRRVLGSPAGVTARDTASAGKLKSILIHEKDTSPQNTYMISTIYGRNLSFPAPAHTAFFLRPHILRKKSSGPAHFRTAGRARPRIRTGKIPPEVRPGGAYLPGRAKHAILLS